MCQVLGSCASEEFRSVEAHTAEVLRDITRQRDHAAYSRCMRSLVDEMGTIALTFYTEKMLIRHIFTAGALDCENTLSSLISLHSQSLFIYFCFVKCCIENEKMGFGETDYRGIDGSMKRQKVMFLILNNKAVKYRKLIQSVRVLQDVHFKVEEDIN